MKKTEPIFLSLGSNVGDRASHLNQAKIWVAEKVGVIEKQSSVYETLPWGKVDQPNFFNQVVQVNSTLQAKELLSAILLIEKKLGRERNEKWAARSIDIDILYFGNTVVCEKELVIPHPLLSERKFVLVPLVEISPEFIHPVLKKNNRSLLHECIDPLAVKKIID